MDNNKPMLFQNDFYQGDHLEESFNRRQEIHIKKTQLKI